MQHKVTAEEGYASALGEYGVIGRYANFVCPTCSAFAQHEWGHTLEAYSYDDNESARRRRNLESGFVFAACCSCKHECLFKDGRLIYPSAVGAPPPAEDMPEQIKGDFEEARQIARLSPRGAAALLRLAIQKLCPLIGAAESDINKMIGQLVSDGKIPVVVQQALDSVRVIGNEAVHPGTIDLKDDVSTATTLFELVNFIVEKAISEPKKIAAIFGSLPPGKLAGIAQRDAASSEPGK